ncbi:hypothetical protein [Aeromicrobium endophyticum]|uniref:Uncharacterized protein n=1 Tax=Aeromicrobium endophyticum TaxID=2292704 RepID=A0A371P4R8_9ACTN|nr:hypothetical protein [Aeromicrobium endophyticum]REK70937.1 hypothetical protein DX116_17820 [Aeromicrobium endophyticum]
MIFLVDVLIEVAIALFEPFDRSGRTSSLYTAYRAAWRRRIKDRDPDLGLLVAEMKRRSVPGAYDPLDSPRIAPAVEAWLSGTEPREARATLASTSGKRKR